MDNDIRVLYVDDEPDFAELTATYLERENDRIAAVTATSASTGLSLLEAEDIDCVISDYDMPEMNGVAFLEALRPDYPELPFILFTGQGSEEVASHAISAGVTDYMQKAVGTGQYAVLAQRVHNVVTKRRAREQAQQAQKRVRTILNASPDAILVTVNGAFDYANPAAVELFNATSEADLLDRSLSDLVVPDDRAALDDALGTLRGEDDLLTRLRYTAQTLDDFPVPVEVNGRAITWDGQPGVIAIFRDLSTGETLQNKLEENHVFTQQAIDTLDDIFYVVGLDGELIRWNRQLPHVTGYADEEISKMHPADFFADADADRITDGIEQALRTGQATVEADLRTSNGERIPYEFSSRRMTDADGDPVGIAGVGRDITTRKDRERELTRSNRLLSTLFETLPVGVTVLDTDGRIVRANRRAEELLGLTMSETSDRTYEAPEWQIIDEDGEPVPDSELPFARVRDTGESVFDYEHGIRWPDGTERWLSVNATPLPTTGDALERVVAAITDVTEQREHEQTIEQQNERLEKFASVVSHDLQSPLTVAQGRLELARENPDSEHLDAIGRAHERMDVLIEDVLTLAREGQPVSDVESVSLPTVVNRCWRNVETDAATLLVETDSRIQADASRLKQLLENLIRNAVEHGGDEVTVRFGDLADGSGFYVEDDGVGIPDDERDRIFDAGYTTTTDGTGLGLDIVTEIVDAHGWEIRVTAGQDGGARFEISGVEGDRTTADASG